MTTTPVSDLAERLQRERERERQQHFRELGDEPVAWLAIAPIWTDRVARACGFPERPLPLPDLLDRAEAAGWCVRREAQGGPRTPWLRLEMAVELLSYLPAEQREPVAGEVQRIPDVGVRSLLLDRVGGEPPEHPVPPASEVDPEAVTRSVAEGDPVAAARTLREAATRLPQRTVEVLAADLAERLESAAPTSQALALADVVAAQAQAGLTEQGMEVARRIQDRRTLVTALGELVAPLVRAGEPSVVSDLVTTCRGLARTAAGSLDPTIVAPLADRLAEAGATDLLEEVADQALAAARGGAPTPALVGAMVRIAAALDDAEHAPAFVEVTVDLAARVGDPVARAAALASTAAWVRRQDPAATGRYPAIADSALLEAARALEDGEDRVRALARLVPLVAERSRAGVAQEALRLAHEIEEAAGAVTFWMPETARGAVIEELQRRRSVGWLQQTAGRIGASMREAGRTVAMPAPLARWAELAVTAPRVGQEGPASETVVPPTLSSQAAATHLDRRVTELLEVGDTGQALTWLDTARSLGPLLLGQFEVSVLANTRRVELVHRRWLDRRRLERFLPRAEQLAAFDDLLGQPDVGGAWALHYLGVGGVGKTMLIRYLTGELAPARDVLTSRIDFDHLNPDFPRRRPAQLLVELATELEAQAQDTQTIGLFRSAYERLQEVNARAEPVTVEHPGFARALRAFAGFLQALGRRVVLILDTCEELEKFRPAGGRLEQLEATFEVLEALHRQVPTLRVVLAGRRPLARSGRGWRLAGHADRRYALLPGSKPDLLLHEVRGFDRRESEEFLARRAGLRADPELLAAILEKSPDPGTAARIEWDHGREPPAVPRHNPFDLDLIAGWVLADPGMTATLLRASQSDLYVERRIVGRLRDLDVETLLPAVVALGRFDHDMLRLAFDGDEQSLTDAERRLASTEWIDAQRDEALDTTFLEVDRNLHPRLEAQYRGQHPGLLREAARRLGSGLAALIRDPGRRRPLGRLGFEHVDAALRLLPPPDAARLVDHLAMRVVEEAAWGWAEGVAERLLAPGSPLAAPEHPAGAGLRAMLASALGHLDQQRDLSELWRAVEQHPPNHPDPEVARWLAYRAFLQLLVASPAARLPEELLASLGIGEGMPGVGPEPEARRQVLAGGLLWALQRLLDQAEADSRRGALPDTATLQAVTEAVSGLATGTGGAAADAFRHMLLGRAARLQGRFDHARAVFEYAASRLPDAPVSPWLRADWEPPDDLRSRVLLEAVRGPIATLEGDVRFQLLLDRGLGGVDAERLASATLGWLLDREVMPADQLEGFERIPDLYEEREPACEAHRAVPPFFVTLARGWAALGRAQRALQLLRQGHDAAVRLRDSATVATAASARLEVVRRFRLATEERSLREEMLHARTPADRQRAWPLAVLVDPPDPVDRPPENAWAPELHAWWRVQTADAWLDRTAETLLMHRSSQAEPGSFVALSLELDIVELRKLLGHPAPAPRLHTMAFATHHRVEAEHALRLELRQLALTGTAPDLDDWQALMGPRRVAELALDEGELLALRLPGDAERLLLRAAALFHRSGDRVGEFIARVLIALTFEQDGPVAAEGLKAAYEALPKDPKGKTLPLWADLPVLGRDRTRLDHPDWGGWLPRLLVAYARLHGATEREMRSLAEDLGLRSPELRDARRPGVSMTTGLAASQPAGSEPPPTPSVPPRQPQEPEVPPFDVGSQRSLETDGTVSARPAPAGRPPAGPARAPRRRVTRLAVLFALVVVLVGLSYLLSETPQNASVRPWYDQEADWLSNLPGTLVVVLALTAVAVVVTAGLNLAGWLVKRLLRRIRARPEMGALPEMGTLRIRRPAGVGFATFELKGQKNWMGELPSFAPYSRQRDLVLRPLPAAVRQPLPPSVALQVAPELAALPWEAVVLPATRPPRRTEQRACWRELDPLAAAGQKPTGRPPWWRRNHGQCWVVAPRMWQPLFMEHLSEVTVIPVDPIDVALPFETVVIMGTPVETSAGTRLQLQLDRGAQLLVEPDAERYHDHSLVVVVGEPSEGAVRVDAEREATADLRRCAADLAAAGARSVLCLPSMPSELTGQVLRELDRRLRRVERGGWRALVSTTEALRQWIETSVPLTTKTLSDAEKARELALEVTVFVRPGRAT